MPTASFWRWVCGPVVVLALTMLAGCQRPSGVVKSTTATATMATTTVGPIASAGCGQPTLSTRGVTTTLTLVSSNLTRTYRLHVPSGYAVDHPTPLVVNFHGHGSNATEQENYSRFSPLADQQNFVVVYPQGTVGPDQKTGWASYGASDPTVDDVQFVSDLLDALQSHLCINPQRIYATGISNGGGMTNLLACTLARRIAAFAPVAGAFYPIPGGCQPGRPAPILEFHGTSDPLMTYTGRPTAQLPPIATWLQEWATRDHCAIGPTTFFQQDDVTGEQWSGCATGGAVIHYRIDSGGHTWPGAIDVPVLGRTTHTIDATTIMWQFFTTQTLT